jgi:cell division protein FtsA
MKIMVQHIQPSEVAGIKDMTGRVTDHTYITAMGLLRVGLDTVQYVGSSTEGIKDKIDRILRV